MYLELFRSRDRFVVIDDVDSLYSDRNGLRLLKCLCQSEDSKAVAWHSASRALEKAKIPREFVTTSRVIIICNEWKTLNRNVAALQDRGHVLCFRPSASEVHERAKEFFRDEDVLSWFEDNLHRLLEPSLRLYLRAAELKTSGMEWKHLAPLSPENLRKKLVLELSKDPSHSSEKSRIEAFHAKGGGCRATYFNYKRTSVA